MLLVRAFYAEGESWRPLIINIVSSILSVGAAFWFAQRLSPGQDVGFANFVSGVLRLGDISDIRVISLPLGIFVGSLFNFIFLFFSFKAVFGWFPARGAGRTLFQVFSASAMGGLAAYSGLNIFSSFFDLRTFLGIFFQGFFAGILGILATAAVLWILKSPELFEIYHSFKVFFLEKEKSKSDMVPAPEPEKLL